MKLMINATVHNSLRVYIHNPSTLVSTIMDCISIWGGADKVGVNYRSWEIDKTSRAMVSKCMARCRINGEDFELKEAL